MKYSVKRCSQKFRKTDRNRPVSEFLFLHPFGLQRYYKRDSARGVFLHILAKFLKAPFLLNTEAVVQMNF